MSGATTKKSTVTTAITEREIHSRLREMVKQVRRLKKAGVRLSTDPYRLLLKTGEFFVGAAAVKSDPVVHVHVRRYRPKPKECFYNCQKFVILDGTDHATYYEGFVTDVAGRLTHHGWLVVNGVVIDPTLEAAVRRAKRWGINFDPPNVRQYYGVPFAMLDVAKRMAGGVCHPMLDGVFHTI
jgi:hypothetical protein